MPKRNDIQKILIIGSGPIIIGQGCEFDYSGVQACKSLKNCGYEIVLVNSNPATIMTDPDLADHTYIEPITWQTVAQIINIERPDAILSTMGGQTALNCALDLDRHGILKKYNIELIGANKLAIEKAEDREQFNQAMQKINLQMAKCFAVTNMQQAWAAQREIGFPVIIRPSYTLGGSGGGIAYNEQEFTQICSHGLELSTNSQILIEESLLGWKEYELEVVRDANDTCIIICTIENLDPMGIHTGDSITVAPAQTLTDQEYQIMRNAAIAILREIGVETGGSNVQFAIHPQTGRMVIIEMNPRVSRSSALASKATGFPIAKIAALLAVGYTLDELQNDITGGVIPASFEPTIDYVVVKIPRFNFDKFPQVNPQLTTQMQAIGEVMAVGSTFQAALQKAICSLEIDLNGFNELTNTAEKIIHELQHAGPLRLLFIADAFRLGWSIQEIYNYTNIDPWFLDQILDLINTEAAIKQLKPAELDFKRLLFYKQRGFSDSRLANLLNVTQQQIRDLRLAQGITPKFKRIDSCAAEFPASTAYLYATYDGFCEAEVTNKPKVIVLGSGPNRIGQGIEFDYCCVQAVQALKDQHIEAIMINCNPETVSTDYDTADRLYFEALTLESVLDIIELEKPLGVILQLGGQTPLKLAAGLQKRGIKILGTSPETIDLAEDRAKFSAIINQLQLKQPANATISTVEHGLQAAEQLGYPLMVRPSYVLGGRDMQVVYTATELQNYLTIAFAKAKKYPVLIDCFLQQAIEIDVDIIADGQGGALVVGVMEHVEPAGVHSGDSAACLPPHSLSKQLQNSLEIQARNIALALKINGLMNIQFAVQEQEIYILEVNPRASRTVPFVSKAISWSVAKAAVACMLGKTLKQQNISLNKHTGLFAVKQSVFPFIKFAGADPLLGPEMRSTGEVMAFGDSFAAAYKKSLLAAGACPIQFPAAVYIDLAETDQHEYDNLKLACINLGFTVLTDFDLTITKLVISTVFAQPRLVAAQQIRATAVRHRINLCTTVAGAWAVLQGLELKTESSLEVYKLQNTHLMGEVNPSITLVAG